MKKMLSNEVSLSVQIRQKIEDMIVEGTLSPGDQVPSSTQMVKFYQVNHITVLKGVNMLVEDGLIFKKRGVGMFVSDNARNILLTKRKQQINRNYIVPLLQEAGKLGIPVQDLLQMIGDTSQEGVHDED